MEGEPSGEPVVRTKGADLLDGFDSEGHVLIGEDSPAYQILKDHGMLEFKYRIRSVTEIAGIVPANSSAARNAWLKFISWLFFPCAGPCVFGCCTARASVPAGAVATYEDGNGGYGMLGQGVHLMCSPFVKTRSPVVYAQEAVQHGDISLCVVQQGFIGFAQDRGQPVLLPPGMHAWKSPTLRLERMVDLNTNVIPLGPYTLLTVDEGYAAVTQDNGRQVILAGGGVYLLTHRNWKFEKFLSLKICTSDLERIEVITADNVLMWVDATVNWRIVDVGLAARNAAETMRDGNARGALGAAMAEDVAGVTKLARDVLKQAEASLSSFIGTVNYSATFSVAAAVQARAAAAASGGIPTVAAVPAAAAAISAVTGGAAPTAARAGPVEAPIAVGLIDADRLRSAVLHANDVTQAYGVQIISINVISMRPADAALMTSLARGAVAAAEARQLETTAEGRAKAVRIEALAAAEAERIRAGGSKAAADMLAQTGVAVELARIDRIGEALGKAKATTLFFGEESGGGLGSFVPRADAMRGAIGGGGRPALSAASVAAI